MRDGDRQDGRGHNTGGERHDGVGPTILGETDKTDIGPTIRAGNRQYGQRTDNTGSMGTDNTNEGPTIQASRFQVRRATACHRVEVWGWLGGGGVGCE